MEDIRFQWIETDRQLDNFLNLLMHMLNNNNKFTVEKENVCW